MGVVARPTFPNTRSTSGNSRCRPERGGHVLARYHSLINPTEGILAIGEYRRNIPAPKFVERIEGRALVMGNLAEASIGHELTADALEIGFAAAVKAYRAALRGQ